MEKIYRVQMNSKGMPNFSTAVEIDTDISEYSDKLWKNAYERGKAERPQGWIPCSERLPNEKEIVLITNDKGNVRCGQFRGTYKKWWNWKGNTLETVLAWMPLPKPWKGADDE